MTDSIEREALWRAIGDLNRRMDRLETNVLKNAEVSPPPLSVEPVPVVPVADAVIAAEPVPPIPHLPPPMLAMPIEPLPEPRPQRSLEATIGLNWTGWIGALVLVLGVLFFLKYAWDRGWIHPTPTMRVLTSVAAGMAIGLLGERMHRKGVRVLAATLHGAGIAIVMASFFAAYALFDAPQRVLSSGGAFAGVAITAAIGVAIALHVDAVVLAVIALLGAYLAPFVLNTGEDHSLEFLTYTGVLAAAAWGLCHLKPRWSILRGMCWACTFVAFASWWSELGQSNQHTEMAALFLAIYFAGFLGEMILTIRKYPTPDAPMRGTTGMAMLSLLNTAATLGLCFAIYDSPGDQHLLGWIAVGLALGQGAAAFATESRGFALSSLLQSAALATLAVPLLLDQYVITLAWLALAGALAVLARELNIVAARRWAIVLLLLAMGRLFLFDGRLRNSIVFSAGTFSISRWMLMAWGMALFAHVIAWLRPRVAGRIPALELRLARMALHTPVLWGGKVALNYAAPDQPGEARGIDVTGIMASVFGTALFLGASATVYEDSVLMLIALLWLIPMLVLAGRAKNLAYLWHALVVAAPASVFWFAADGVLPIARNWDSISGPIVLPILNLVALNGLILAGLFFGLLVQMRRMQPQAKEAIRAIGVGLGVILLATVNFEACRVVDQVGPANPGIVKHVVMSVLWGLTGFTAVVVGFRRNIAPLRYAALTLLGVTLLKIFAFDMAEVKAIWRILSFIATGALLLGVSYLYHRQLERRAVEAG